MTTTATTATTLTCSTATPGVVGIEVPMVVVYFFWFSFVCPYDVVPSRLKHGEKVFRWPLLLDKLSTRIQKSFVSTPKIYSI